MSPPFLAMIGKFCHHSCHALCGRALWPSVCRRISLIKGLWAPRLMSSLLFFAFPRSPAQQCPDLHGKFKTFESSIWMRGWAGPSVFLWRQTISLANCHSFWSIALLRIFVTYIQEQVCGIQNTGCPFPWCFYITYFTLILFSWFFFLIYIFYVPYYTVIQIYFPLGILNLVFISGNIAFFLQFTSCVLSFTISKVT